MFLCFVVHTSHPALGARDSWGAGDRKAVKEFLFLSPKPRCHSAVLCTTPRLKRTPGNSVDFNRPVAANYP